ncbi:MAG: hypothetical protein JNK82_14755 [Myxococcaceae bacterium]|nr:hypothetical protein [Myxococcaceae bacterium]
MSSNLSVNAGVRPVTTLRTDDVAGAKATAPQQQQPAKAVDTQAFVAGGSAAPLEHFKSQPFLISQFGRIANGEHPARPLVPGHTFDRLEVTAGDGTTKATFEFDANGAVKPNLSNPLLGTHPYTLTLVKGDAQWSAKVDVSPAKVKSSHQGYETVAPEFTRVPPAQPEAPQPPATFESKLFISQSGQVFAPGTRGMEGQKQPVLKGFEGAFRALTVKALDPAGVHASVSFPIDSGSGAISSKVAERPLGHNPYELILDGNDGQQWKATVDVTPKKLRVSHQGYEEVNVRFEAVPVDPSKVEWR